MTKTPSNTEQRHLSRDSLFVMAGLRVAGQPSEHRIKVRNISSGGLMAEGALRIARGTPVSVEVRNIGWVDGSVAWVQDNRFGIAFDKDIDPLEARGAAVPTPITGFEPRRPTVVLGQMIQHDPNRLRKI
ncbi:MAG: PilZ domain-containing protein [Sphingomonadales bacterium]|nr:PilZ domain-containing protein [Sphingomonadales bacterium]MDE2169000.1 PilZ domain-containing protein [Sphingomonadales bacterium]